MFKVDQKIVRTKSTTWKLCSDHFFVCVFFFNIWFPNARAAQAHWIKGRIIISVFSLVIPSKLLMDDSPKEVCLNFGNFLPWFLERPKTLKCIWNEIFDNNFIVLLGSALKDKITVVNNLSRSKVMTVWSSQNQMKKWQEIEQKSIRIV